VSLARNVFEGIGLVGGEVVLTFHIVVNATCFL